MHNVCVYVLFYVCMLVLHVLTADLLEFNREIAIVGCIFSQYYHQMV